LPGELYPLLTWDKGKELADHQRLTLATEVEVYLVVLNHPGSAVLVWNTRLCDELPVRNPSFASAALAVAGKHFLDAQTRLNEISME